MSLTADVAVEMIRRGAAYDVGDLYYTEDGEERYSSDGPVVCNPSTGVYAPVWRAGEVRRYWRVGDLKPLHELTEAQRSMIAGIEVVMKNAVAGDGQIDRILKIKLAPRERYVEMAAKVHGLLIEKVDVNVSHVGSRLDQAREQARQRNIGAGQTPAAELASRPRPALPEPSAFERAISGEAIEVSPVLPTPKSETDRKP